jgi:hypothetical protein
LLTAVPAEFYFGNEVDQVPAGVQTEDSISVFVTRLHESHQVSVYAAIERLVRAGEAVGVDAHAILRMLDQGVSLEALLGLNREWKVRVEPHSPELKPSDDRNTRQK